MKKCKICRESFEPPRSLQKVCSMACALELAKQERVKKDRAASREMKKRVRDKDRSYWVKKAQEVFNQWIRLRDDKQPCISCGTRGPCQFHAGHYKTAGGHPELRFEPLNVHKQCAQCNNYKSGAIDQYRPRLIYRIGEDNVKWLEGPHPPVKYTIDDLKGLIKTYRAKIKESEHESNSESRERKEDY